MTYTRRLPGNETLPRHVYRHKCARLVSPRFIAMIKVRGRQVYLGSFKTPDEAGDVALTYCRKHGLKT